MNILINIYDYYITPDEYEEAKRNGIRSRQVEIRVRDYAWKKQDAITRITQVKIYRPHIKPVLIEHGITYKQFLSRINQGWDEWKAATTPLRDPESLKRQITQLGYSNRRYPIELIELAAKNGISSAQFRVRVRSGWSVELAYTLPPSPSNSAMILKQKYGDDYFSHYLRNLKSWLFVKLKK